MQRAHCTILCTTGIQSQATKWPTQSNFFHERVISLHRPLNLTCNRSNNSSNFTQVNFSLQYTVQHLSRYAGGGITALAYLPLILWMYLMITPAHSLYWTTGQPFPHYLVYFLDSRLTLPQPCPHNPSMAPKLEHSLSLLTGFFPRESTQAYLFSNTQDLLVFPLANQ